ncbi:hypothetical protein MTO96_001565 [Rhipicephalus appendiculatus]
MPNVVTDRAPEKKPDKQPDRQLDSSPSKQPEGNPKKRQGRTSGKKPAGAPAEPCARPQDLEINDPFDRTCLLERVCQSLADIPSASRRGSRESPEQLSSESELTLDAVLAKQSSQDEFETLLAQDSVESEEFLSVASAVAPPPPSRSPVPTRQQRLEVVTIPIPNGRGARRPSTSRRSRRSCRRCRRSPAPPTRSGCSCPGSSSQVVARVAPAGARSRVGCTFVRKVCRVRGAARGPRTARQPAAVTAPVRRPRTRTAPATAITSLPGAAL